MTRVVRAAVATVFALAMLAPIAAAAQNGAIAYDPETRTWGRAADMASEAEAEAAALAACRATGCRIVVRTGPGECGAIAAPPHGSRHVGSTRFSRAEAQFGAVQRCQADAGQHCDVVVAQCNRKAMPDGDPAPVRNGTSAPDRRWDRQVIRHSDG
jgi:hypothetical protein